MSSQELTRAAPDHKVLNLYGAQVHVYENAKEAAKRELGDDATEGEIVRELARAYTGCDTGPPPAVLGEMLDEHASDNGDPTYTYGELEGMNHQRLRNMASEADTDAIDGRTPGVQIYAYYLEGADE